MSTLEVALIQLESLGAEIVSISLPHTKMALGAYAVIAAAEASSNLSRYHDIQRLSGTRLDFS